ncbi:MAG: hypothetical protein Q4D98_06790 [Planctomycetia bacterium]|nr:hypothetical protein [Planctomycetia bacterium]
MTRKMIGVVSLLGLLALVSEAMAQYPYAVPVRPQVASKMVVTDGGAVTPGKETKVEETKVEAKAEATVSTSAKQAKQSVSEMPLVAHPVAPAQAHAGYTRAAIRSMPILERPNRPGHFYGNAVRRRAGTAY